MAAAPASAPAPVPAPLVQPAFGEALRFWARLGCISFGGPTAQIALLHEECVERRRWIDEGSFLRGLNFVMLLPGPEAQQLATYIGWRLHGVWGGIASGGLFVLPAALLLWGLSWLYVTFGALPAVAGIVYGLKVAVLGIVAHAVVRIAGRALKHPSLWAVAALAFAAIGALGAPFPLVLLGAALSGFLLGRWRPDWLRLAPAPSPAAAARVRVPWRTLAVCAALWWLPVAAAWLLLGREHTLTALGLFFAHTAVVTFGGAYAILPYVAQQAVETYGWLSPVQMMAGLGLAETTPGPLIMVLQFVGFVGAWQHPMGLPPLVAATLGAALTTWVTFLPSFLFIFAGGPLIALTERKPLLTAALSGVTAAVVGVVLHLAFWFGWHLLWPAADGFDAFAAVVAVGVFVALWRFRLGLLPVILMATALALAWRLFGG